MQLKPTQSSPSLEQWSAYQSAFDYFNIELFNGECPHCLLNFSRRSKSLGFFAAERWAKEEAITHEISLNPDHLMSRGAKDMLSTLVHEMAHLLDWTRGNSSSRGYHGMQWVEIMQSVGLIPSDTGRPGGKMTGFKMTHYIAPGGKFEQVFERMPAEFLIPWKSGFVSDYVHLSKSGKEAVPEGKGKEKTQKNKMKYSCPNCSTNVWGKQGLQLLCLECDLPFKEQD